MLRVPVGVDLVLVRDGKDRVVVVQIAGDHRADGLLVVDHRRRRVRWRSRWRSGGSTSARAAAAPSAAAATAATSRTTRAVCCRTCATRAIRATPAATEATAPTTTATSRRRLGNRRQINAELFRLPLHVLVERRR